MRRVNRLLLLAAGAAALAAPLAATASATTDAGGVRVVLKGLNNPRGVEVAPNGAVYVANAGAAGRLCMGKGQDQQCGGFTGSIVKIAHGKAQRFSTGFLSVGGRDGSFAVGVDDVAVGPGSNVYAIETSLGAHVPPSIPKRARAQSGKLLQLGPGAAKTPFADVEKIEFTENPDGAQIDSDPYSVAWGPFGLVVADAAANALLRVGPGGRHSVLAVFPKRRFGGKLVDAVPTSVAVGPDGAYYVGELGGDGTPNGHADIWRVVPGQEPIVWKTGFTAVVGLDFGPDGSAYVVELAKHGLAAAQNGDITGALIRVAPDGRRTELVPGQLHAPGGVGVASDGTVYVTDGSILPGKGRLLAIRSASGSTG